MIESSSDVVSRRVSRPIFASLGLEGYGSRSRRLQLSVLKVSGLETSNIANKWFSKISIIQIFLFAVFAGKKQPKHVGKMPEP